MSFLDSISNTLNPEQLSGVTTTEGPLLLLAGAGTGKTRVLTHRIAYLIEEEGVNPWNILAVTFTNKAAREMKERVEALIRYSDYSESEVWVSTFHSTCVRILRRYADRLGYDNNFTIYDTDDQKSVVKDILKRLNIDSKMMRTIMGNISAAKDELISPAEYAIEAYGDYIKGMSSKVYREYQETLKKNNAMDFDDLIVKTVELFKACPEILQMYQNRFRYILVDEYQDTNTAQFELVRLLADKCRNLCVVGDDDQSIYKFRGANIRNILDFEKTYPEAVTIRLEQNYRSRKYILDAANAVISNNFGRKGKNLWSNKGEGQKLTFRQFDTALEEAAFVAEDIRHKCLMDGLDYGDCAVLYRTNAQSRMLEERMFTLGVPYTIVGGQNFYGRKEIKDILAYLKTIDNGRDDVAVKRIINIPKRSIGATSIGKVQEYADAHSMSFYDALLQVDQIPGVSRAQTAIKSFVSLIQGFRAKATFYSVENLIKDIVETIDYETYLSEAYEDADDRLTNIQELVSKAAYFEEKHDKPTLGEFLEEVALFTDADNVENDTNRVLLMTLHGAKGLEFPHVYLVGMEDGVFPGYVNITSENREDMEEERRLAYVGITRAMEKLTLTCAKCRMINGETQYNMVSRFVKEIPSEFIEGEMPRPRFQREMPVDLEAKQFASRPVFDYTSKVDARPKATPKPNVTNDMVKPYIAKGIGSLNNVAGLSKGIGAAKAPLEYAVGDHVQHIKFGDGIVTAIVEEPRDYKVSVEFEDYGPKVMYASFAKLKKC